MGERVGGEVYELLNARLATGGSSSVDPIKSGQNGESVLFRLPPTSPPATHPPPPTPPYFPQCCRGRSGRKKKERRRRASAVGKCCSRGSFQHVDKAANVMRFCCVFFLKVGECEGDKGGGQQAVRIFWKVPRCHRGEATGAVRPLPKGSRTAGESLDRREKGESKCR